MAVLPAYVVENDNHHGSADLVKAVDETDDSKYAVLDVYGSTSYETIDTFVKNNAYVKIVLQEDWSCTDIAYVNINGSSGVIYDLNGHTVDVGNNAWQIFADYIQIRDSSTMGTGKVECGYGYMCGSSDIYVGIYGGTFNGNFFVLDVLHRNENAQIVLEIYGGVHNQIRIQSCGTHHVRIYGGLFREDIVLRYNTVVDYAAKVNIEIATYDKDSNLLLVSLPDYFAVSVSDLVSGAYNYAYALGWELSGAELNSLQIPAGKTYYLWGRNQNGQYKYLGLRYTDGAWRNAA